MVGLKVETKVVTTVLMMADDWADLTVARKAEHLAAVLVGLRVEETVAEKAAGMVVLWVASRVEMLDGQMADLLVFRLAVSLVGEMVAERVVEKAVVSAVTEVAGMVDSRGCLMAEQRDSEMAGL